MFDHVLMIVEIILLIVVVWQGEIIVRCERGVYRLQKEREEERRAWRQAKQKATVKRIEQKIAGIEKSSELTSLKSIADAANKTIDVKSVSDPS